MTTSFSSHGFRTCVVAALALCGVAFMAAGEAAAATQRVTNCNNSGSGSLRAAAAIAVSGDTIDLSQLTCTRITLASEILLPQSTVRLLGRDRLALTLHGNRATRVLHHTGTGTLTVERLSVSYGLRTNVERARGGCIESHGNLAMRQSRAHHCVADANVGMQPVAFGGAIHADGSVLLDRSSVFENHAVGLLQSLGGGIDSAGRTTLLRSQVYNNSADNGGGISADDGLRMAYSLLQGNLATIRGGGANVRGNSEINKSTVAGNHAELSTGAIVFSDGATQSVAVIAESTISGNTSGGNVSAIAFVSADGRIYNSTITANHETGDDECWGAVFSFGFHMESTVASGNTCTDFLVGGRDIGDLLTGDIHFVTGSHNLIGSSSLATPDDTVVSSAPGLGPLAWNGGPTRTHATSSGSPLIDAGNNLLNRSFDQRGAPFARVRGAAPDIGAFER